MAARSIILEEALRFNRAVGGSRIFGAGNAVLREGAGAGIAVPREGAGVAILKAGVSGLARTPADEIQAALNSDIPMWLRVHEAAKLARVSEGRIRDLIREGKLRSTKFAGTATLVSTASFFGLFGATEDGESESGDGDGGN